MKNIGETILWDGEVLATIIVGLVSKKILDICKLNWKYHQGVSYLSLDEIQKQVREIQKKQFREKGVRENLIKDWNPFITIIYEMGTKGYIYQYKNYDDRWVKHGETRGYV